MNKSRLEAFSHGIFAVVITLLVLDIKLPPDVAYRQLPALHMLLPKVGSYLLSFSVVGINRSVDSVEDVRMPLVAPLPADHFDEVARIATFFDSTLSALDERVLRACLDG